MHAVHITHGPALGGEHPSCICGLCVYISVVHACVHVERLGPGRGQMVGAVDRANDQGPLPLRGFPECTLVLSAFYNYDGKPVPCDAVLSHRTLYVVFRIEGFSMVV